ncbi:MAG: L-ribulose-5-phosphate 3-epimerase [Suipraeoptans sp.]
MIDLHKIPIGIYEKALPDSFTWEEKLIVAKRAGYNFMEISIDESEERLNRLNWNDAQIKEMRELMEKIGIGIPSMCLSGHRKFSLGSKSLTTRKRAYEIMEKAIVLCNKLGISCIQLATYDVYYEQSDQETKALFLQGLKDSVDMAAKAGVVLAMEIMDTEFVGTILRATHYLREIQSPYLKIYPDIGNLSQFSSDPESEFELGISEIVAIHIKETKPGVFKGVPFGTGNVRFTDIFAKLHELNYKGRYLVEMWADNSKRYTLDGATAEIKEAKEFVRDKMRQAGYMEV